MSKLGFPSRPFSDLCLTLLDFRIPLPAFLVKPAQGQHAVETYRRVVGGRLENGRVVEVNEWGLHISLAQEITEIQSLRFSEVRIYLYS